MEERSEGWCRERAAAAAAACISQRVPTAVVSSDHRTASPSRVAAAAVAAAALLLRYYCSMHAILGRPLHVPLHHFDCNRSGAATALPPPAAALRCRQAQGALNT